MTGAANDFTTRAASALRRVGAGLAIDEVVEVGEPTPDVLAIRAHRG